MDDTSAAMASEQEGPKLTLKFKLQPGTLPDTDTLTLPELPAKSTIGALRQHIQQAIPSHPPQERQRLLYGGRALIDNAQTLADALDVGRRPNEDMERVVHLVIRPDANAAPAGPPRAMPRPQSTPNAQVNPLQPPNAPPIAGGINIQQLHQEHAARQQAMIQQMLRTQQQAGQVPVPLPPQQTFPGFGLPPGFRPGAGFNQAVAAQQQQRAAAGMTGVGGPNGGAPRVDEAAQQTGREGVGNDRPMGRAESEPHGLPHMPPGERRPTGPGQPAPAGHPHTQQPPGRPVSGQGFVMQGMGPNGERITINHQTMHFPNMQPGQQMPFQMPLVPQFPQGLVPPFAGIPGQQQPQGPSALDRARENVAEMQRMLTELRGQNGVTDEQRTRLDSLQERTREVNNYIDPFQLGNLNPAGRSTSPRPPNQPPNVQPQARRPPQPMTSHQFANIPGLFQAQVHANTTAQTAPMASPNEVTCYLLSSPTGPHALLFHPQHGTYTTPSSVNQPVPSVGDCYRTGVFPTTLQQPATRAPPTPTPTTQPPAQPADPAPQPNNQQIALQQPAQAAADQPAPAEQAGDPLAPIQGLLNNVWMLLRLLIFAYFVLGSGLGWRRPAILLAVGFLFWLVNAGPGGDRVRAAVRGWWEGVVAVPRQGVPAHADGEGEAPQQQQQRQQQGDGGRAGQMPTPEQVAQRLMAERQQRGGWLREQIRPVERAVALFVASLWPGIGEAHVRAREAEERRVAEEEAARRAREEEDRGRREEEEKTKREGGEGSASAEGKENGEVGGGEKVGTSATGEGEGSAGPEVKEEREAVKTETST